MSDIVDSVELCIQLHPAPPSSQRIAHYFSYSNVCSSKPHSIPRCYLGQSPAHASNRRTVNGENRFGARARTKAIIDVIPCKAPSSHCTTSAPFIHWARPLRLFSLHASSVSPHNIFFQLNAISQRKEQSPCIPPAPDTYSCPSPQEQLRATSLFPIPKFDYKQAICQLSEFSLRAALPLPSLSARLSTPLPCARRARNRISVCPSAHPYPLLRRPSAIRRSARRSSITPADKHRRRVSRRGGGEPQEGAGPEAQGRQGPLGGGSCERFGERCTLTPCAECISMNALAISAPWTRANMNVGQG